MTNLVDKDQTIERNSQGKLIICPTPIGNLKDITLRVLETLSTVDLIACEDTRRTGTLLKHFEISKKLISYHEHNEAARAIELVQKIQEGNRVALVSDAGLPTVSDPGFSLLQACINANLLVEVLPGPSSVTVAIVASGLPSESWCFVGFLPRKRSALELALQNKNTIVAFESPHRVAKSLALLAQIDAQRPVAVCRELSKIHEEVVRGCASELSERFTITPARGEVVLVIGAAQIGDSVLGADSIEAVRKLIEAGAKPRAAAGVVADILGLSANELYKATISKG